MGTSTRRTNARVNKILKNSNITNNNLNMNKILSEILFPKHNISKIKKDIIDSTCSASFTNTIKKIILSSDTVSKKGIASFGIVDYQNLQRHEIIEIISDRLCYDEDPIVKQSIIEILQSKDLDKYLVDSFEMIKDFLIEYYTEKFESNIFEDLASNVQDFDDEKCKMDVQKLVEEKVSKIFTYSIYQDIVINVNDESFIRSTFRNVSNYILKELKV